MTTTPSPRKRQLSQHELAMLEQRDAWRAAIHEAAHAVVFRGFTSELQIHLWRDPEVCDPVEMNLVRGRTGYSVVTPPTPLLRAAFGWAGYVAESLKFADDGDDEPEPWQILDYAECIGMDQELSATDLEAINAVPDSQRLRALTIAHARIKKEWDLLSSVAAHLRDDYQRNRNAASIFWTRTGGWRDGNGTGLRLPR